MDIKKTIEEEFYRNFTYEDNSCDGIIFTRVKENVNPRTIEDFITKALKTQEQEHQKKLEEVINYISFDMDIKKTIEKLREKFYYNDGTLHIGGDRLKEMEAFIEKALKN